MDEKKGQETKTVKIAGTRLVPDEHGGLKVDEGQGFVITPSQPTQSAEKPKSRVLPSTSLLDVTQGKLSDPQRRANIRREKSEKRSKKATG